MENTTQKSHPVNPIMVQPSPDRRLWTAQCKILAGEALAKDCWLYDPSSNTWYSPREFQNRFERISLGNLAFLEQIKVRDPMEGIRAGKILEQDL